MYLGSTIKYITQLLGKLDRRSPSIRSNEQLRVFFSDSLTVFGVVSLLLLVSLAIFGPMLAPYSYDEAQYQDDELVRFQPPSTEYLLGTTQTGNDVFSRLIYGARPTAVIGFSTAAIVIAIALAVGLTAGYLGGRVDESLMRLVDLLYGVPLIPAAIMFITFYGMGFWSIILFMGIILWRGSSRVFRSEVMQLKQRPYVQVARSFGGSRPYIVGRHIIPNMMGMIVLFFALSVGLAVLISAGLAFLGLMNPFIPSWGIMLQNAYNSGRMLEVWWWTFPPGIMISWLVLSTYLVGRGYERIQEGKERGVQL